MIGADLRILLVEDEESHAVLVERAFESCESTHLETARNLLEARAVLERGDSEEQEFDLVITDLRLPDGLGIDLVERAEAAAGTAVVIMTSQGDEVAAVEAMKAGAIDYIVKTPESLMNMPRTAMRVIRETRLVKERERLRAALVERERLAAVGTAAAMLAHEIGNPLNSMKLNAELLLRRMSRLSADTSSLEQTLATCMAEIDRLHELVEDFRELSRQGAPSVSAKSVPQLLDSIVESQRAFAEAGGVSIETSFPAEGLVAFLDANKITQVFVNLVKNAIEAMPEGGQLRVEVSVSARHWRATVSDTGTGVPPGVNVFEPFKSTKCHGSGLGLAIVRQIVLAHGGTVSYQNVAEGGTRFETIFPLDPSANSDFQA